MIQGTRSLTPMPLEVPTLYSRIKSIITAIEDVLFYISCLLFMLMMFLGAFDVLGRYLFNRPIPGTMEISSVCMGAVVFFSWATTQRERGHVNVELLISHYPTRMRAAADCFTLSLSLLLFVLITYQSTLIAIRSYEEFRTLPVLEIVIWPFHALVPIGAAVLCLAIVLQIVSSIAVLKKG